MSIQFSSLISPSISLDLLIKGVSKSLFHIAFPTCENILISSSLSETSSIFNAFSNFLIVSFDIFCNSGIITLKFV